jgi:threonine/homoserine/homoserine lactone efflux protein
MRPRMNFIPSIAVPSLKRGWRFGLGVLFLVCLGVSVRMLLRTIHRIHSGETIYGHLLLYISLAAYLLYLLIKVFLLPAAESEEPLGSAGEPRGEGHPHRERLN